MISPEHNPMAVIGPGGARALAREGSVVFDTTGVPPEATAELRL